MNEDRFKRGLQVLSEDVEPSSDALDRLIGKQRTREIRRRLAGGTAGLAVLVALAVVAVQIRPGGQEPPPFRSDSPTPRPGTVVARYIAYAFEGDIYVKDMSGGTRRITTDGNETVDRLPQTHEGRVVWVRQNQDGASSLWSAGVNSTGGAKFLEVPASIQSFTIDEGRRIALLTATDDGQSVSVLDGTVGAPLDWKDADELLAFPPHLGRGVSPEDDVRVEWSADGTKLLVVNTFVENIAFSIQLLDSDGDAIVATPGTHGRWVQNDRWLYRSPRSEWWIRTTAAGGPVFRVPNLPEFSTRPAISPDGANIAVHVEHVDFLPTLFISDIGTGTAVLHDPVQGANPIWLDDHTLLAAAVEACPDDCMEGWRVTGNAIRVDLETGTVTPVPDVASSLDWSIFYTTGGGA